MSQTRTRTSLMNVSQRVAILPDTSLVYPDMWMNVYIEGDRVEQKAFAGMFILSQCGKADTPEEADLVVFTGGSDVNPVLYGEEPHSETRVNEARDKSDMELYEKCLKLGIPMFGVCRGAQFLHVMNGGKLYQHVDNHNGDHQIYDVVKRRIIHNVSSVHHQMCIDNTAGGMTRLADNSAARNRWKNPTENETGCKMDVEAFFYRDTCCLGVQGHPEYRGYGQFTQWCLELINDLMMMSPDCAYRDGHIRLKQELIDERTNRLYKELN